MWSMFTFELLTRWKRFSIHVLSTSPHNEADPARESSTSNGGRLWPCLESCKVQRQPSGGWLTRQMP